MLLTAGKHSDGSQSSEMCISPAFVTGGTDIISCFMGQNPTLPVYKGEIQARNLGMAVEVWNEQGTASLAAATPGPRRGGRVGARGPGRLLGVGSPGSLCLSGEQTAVPRASFDSAQAPRPQPPSACPPEVWEFGELGAQGRQVVGRHPSFWASLPGQPDALTLTMDALTLTMDALGAGFSAGLRRLLLCSLQRLSAVNQQSPPPAASRAGRPARGRAGSWTHAVRLLPLLFHPDRASGGGANPCLREAERERETRGQRGPHQGGRWEPQGAGSVSALRVAGGAARGLAEH